MTRPTITDENGDAHFGYGELLKPDTVDALLTQHNEHAGALDALESVALLLDGKANLVHTHPEAEVTSLVSDLATKAPLVHTHAESDTTNLVSDLAAKVPTARVITATAPIKVDSGASADLSANRTLSVDTYAGTTPGVVPTGTNTTNKFLREDGTWAKVASRNVDFHGASIYSTANQSIPNNTYTAIAFDTENFDIGGFHSNSTNNTRITIPNNNAYYLIKAYQKADAGVGDRYIKIRKNGTTDLAGDVTHGVGALYLHATTTAYLSVGDYVEVLILQTSGLPMNIMANPLYTFDIHLIGT